MRLKQVNGELAASIQPLIQPFPDLFVDLGMFDDLRSLVEVHLQIKIIQ